MSTILVVEDDRSLREALAYNLQREGFRAVVAEDADTAVILARREQPSLILLDLMLPGGSGFEVCRAVRTFTAAPIIMLTARGEEVDRVRGLETGADDYVLKPFSLPELLARIRANLRRVEIDHGAEQDGILAYQGLVADVPRHQVEVGGILVPLQPREFNLLVYFLRHPGTVLTRERLLAEVWRDGFVGARTVDVHVRRLRAKLGAAGMPNLIRTVHHVGYALDGSGTDEGAGENGS
ncbi:MAG TPA: response regulator [Chloroflexota bacterium]|nr:response regulator [Chloroflexota bacterium]